MRKNSSNKNDKTAINHQSSILFAIFSRSAIISVLVIIASFSYLALFERAAINHASTQNTVNRLADNQVFLLNQLVEQLQFDIKALANTPDLINLLNNGDEQAISAFEATLNRYFPRASASKLIKLGPLGIAGIGRDRAGEFNNIELDLLRRISRGESAPPESYLVNKQPAITFAQAISQDNKSYASGALLITFNNALLQEALGRIDLDLGQTSLIQTISKEQILIKIGDAATNAFTVLKPTTVNHWQLRFTPAEQLITATQYPASLLWLCLGLCLASIVASFALALSSTKRALSDNLAHLELMHPGPYSLEGFASIAQRLNQQRKQHSAPASACVEPSAEMPATLESTVADTPEPPASFDRNSITDLPATIFRAYDIRGIADTELNDRCCEAIGLAIGSEARDQGQEAILVAADGRHSSPRIRAALCKGIQASGCDVVDLGLIPSPLLYFATHQLESQSGVMITGSHNPAEYNGIKIVIDGTTLSGNAISHLRERIINNDLREGHGAYRTESINEEYFDYILNDVAIAQPLKIVVDAGNGVAGLIAPRLFEELGCEVISLYCDVDGDFPNHHPDPSVASNLQDLIAEVKAQGADLGIAFDGDGDRLGVVTASGEIVPADRLLMLLAQDVVSRNPGADILFDVKCTRSLNSLISNYGGRPIMWKSGHSYMKEKMIETGALLGGEFSGHIFFKERWFGFDDGIYAAARLIEILSTTDPDLDAQLSVFPTLIATPEIKIISSDIKKFDIIEQLSEHGLFENGKISLLDGIRVDFADGWGLARASNTTPMLTLRFEAIDEQSLARIQALFKEQLLAIDNHLIFEF